MMLSGESEHVYRAITAGLRMRGVDVLTVQEDVRRNTPDALLIDGGCCHQSRIRP